LLLLVPSLLSEFELLKMWGKVGYKYEHNTYFVTFNH
jgi:hypothetical protein